MTPDLRICPGRSIWLMTPRGLVQVAEAPPQGLQLALVPIAPPTPFPGRVAARLPALPISRGYRTQPSTAHVALPPTCVVQPVPFAVSSSSCPPEPNVRVDPADPPHFRRWFTLQFSPSLMFLEPHLEVCNWLSGQGGVVVPGADMALPYLPPFVCSLDALSALLRAKRSLIKSSLQLLSQRSRPQQHQAQAKPDGGAEDTSSRLPDSTSDLRPGGDPAGNGLLPQT